jgi:hypothetical protein
MPAMRRFTCYDYDETFEVPYGTGVPGRQMECPKCGGRNVHRAEGDRGFERERQGAGSAAPILTGSPGGGFGPGRGPGGQGRGQGGASRGPRWA